MKTLNLGCGTSKILDAINLDMSESVKPDIVADIRNPLPFESNEFDEVYMFHIIEHVEKKFHVSILKEVHRVLIPNGYFYISYPEFSTILQNWLANTRGQRDFWEATIYGRQLYPGDYHVSAINTPTFIETLRIAGFKEIIYAPEPIESHNTTLRCKKGTSAISYEELLNQTIYTH